MEIQAPGITGRQPVSEPLQTGIKAIDAMTPWVADSANHHRRPQDWQDDRRHRHDSEPEGQGVKCIYVAIGQKNSSVAQTVKVLEDFGALEYTVVVVASAGDPAPFKFLAPTPAARLVRSGWTRASTPRRLRRPLEAGRGLPPDLVAPSSPTGRELPGDVFYLHSRLLERAAKLSDERGGDR